MVGFKLCASQACDKLFLLLFPILVAGQALALQLTTTSWAGIEFGKPFEITWSGMISTDKVLLSIIRVDSFDAHAFDLGPTTQPGATSFTWVPDHFLFSGEGWRPDSLWQISLEPYDIFSRPRTEEAIRSPIFGIQEPVPSTSAPIASPSFPGIFTATATPTPTTTPAPTPTPTVPDFPAPPPDDGLSQYAKLAIALVVTFAIMIVCVMTYRYKVYGYIWRRNINRAGNTHWPGPSDANLIPLQPIRRNQGGSNTGPAPPERTWLPRDTTWAMMPDL